MNPEEREILETLDRILAGSAVRAALSGMARCVERRLAADPGTVMAWEPIPLETYGAPMPGAILSSWIFVLRSGSSTGAERHPNSRQRMMSFCGSGDLPLFMGNRWIPHPLTDNLDEPIERRWISIPPNIWHQAVVPDRDWTVVSFHTVEAEALIEERPDPLNPARSLRRRYLDDRSETGPDISTVK